MELSSKRTGRKGGPVDIAKGYPISIKATLLVGASVLALVPSTAVATTAKHKKYVATRAPQTDVAAELHALRAQVADLSARLSSVEAAQRASVANVADAELRAAAAQASSAQTQATVTATEAQVTETRLAAVQAKPADAPASNWRAGTAISGRMYFNVSHIDQKSDGKGVGRSTAFDIKRFYLGVDHRFNEVFSANLTTDVSLIANSNTVTGTGANAAAVAPTTFPKTVGETLYIKNAYLQASLSKAITIRAGSADNPWVPFIDDLYGYRFVENVLIDRAGTGFSADWGVHVLGSLADGHVTYQVSAVDGAGYRNPLRSKTVDVEARVAVNFKGVTLGIGGYTGKQGANTDIPYTPATPNNPAAAIPVETDTDVSALHTARRVDAVAAYVSPRFRVGAEYFWAKNWNRVVTATPTPTSDDTADGYSFWGSYIFYRSWSLFGRYDHVRPSKQLFPAVEDRYFNVGVNFEPVKIVDLALVYKHDRVDHGYFRPTNANPSNNAFAIGGVGSGTYDEFGLWGQLRF